MEPGATPRRYWENRYGALTVQSASCLGLSTGFLRGGLYRGMAAAVRRHIRSARGVDALDVGSGVGEWIAFWHALGTGSVAGVDLSDAAVDGLTRRFPGDRFVQGDISASAPYDATFGVISCVNVLQHIADDRLLAAACLHLRAMAEPGSRLVCIDAMTFGRAPEAGPRAVSIVRRVADVRAALLASGWRVDLVEPAIWLFNSPVEVRPRLVCGATRLLWKVISLAARSSTLGRGLSIALFPLDRLLCRLSWGPSSKLILATAVEWET